MNICSPCSGDFAFSNHLLFLYNWFGGKSESAFFFSLWSVYTVKLKLYFPLSPGLFTVNDSKTAISVVQVNKVY